MALWFVAFDAVVAAALWGSISTLTVLGVLHVKRRIELPLHRLRRVGTSKEASL